jgi:toxin YoeB
MKIVFSEEAWEDYLHWQKSDAKILERVHLLIKETLTTPFQGIGKPEPLRHVLQGYWSRRIDAEHRLVYKIEGGHLCIAQLRYHY